MDTVRSEHSEGSITSSRLDDDSATGRASLSFSFSNSQTSRLSTDSASTRSDYLSNYERKFQERKAAKHKRAEKAKRDKEKADRQELFSAELRRKAAREAERQARRREMETWLTDPNELRRIERRSQKRSRDRMRTLKEWYVPATSGPADEVQPVFVAAMNQSNHEPSTRKKVGKPLLSKEAAALKDEEDREALEAVLQRKMAAFTTKLEYLEQLTDPVPTRAKTRAGLSRQRRRIVRGNMLLAPLGPAHSNLKAAKSVANLPSHHEVSSEPKLRASASLQTLRPISRLRVDSEDAEDALDDAEVEQYLLCHRKVAKQGYAAVKLQAIWRMYMRRRRYLPWRQRRARHRRAVFEIWVMTYRVGNRAQRSLLRKYFSAWHIDVVESLQLREMELHLFRQAATQAELPRMVLNLIFTSDWEDERAKRIAAKAAEAAKKKNIAPSSKAAFLGAFMSSAFGDVESASDKGRNRVHQLRAQHVAAREEVSKKVVQHIFRLWKRVHEANKRVGLNAQLCLKRAVRMAFGTRQRWPAEIMLSVFDIWARWASFNRCRRLGLPLPHFAQSNPHWDIWLHNYQERQVRCVKAAAKAPGARLRRFFLRLHAFARRTIRERHVLTLASDHYLGKLRRKALLEWREAIADSASEKKLTRGVLLHFHRYACAKRKLRPLKEALRERHREFLARRAWKSWKRVELHACFKRELNLSRLENSQAWRSRLHRTLDIWRDERDSLLLWKTFQAWTHFVRKRKLFLTLRSLCTRLQRKTLLLGVFDAWKAAKWDRVDGFLEDRLRLDAWDAYRELSVFFPMMFYGSFSDAGAIFGGLPSRMNGDSNAMRLSNQSKEEVLLYTSGDAVRHFHGVLVRDSVVEVRNAIIQARHLVNAVDVSTGNTALHVAAQIDESERRMDILTLLLSEGAATLKRVNRHGLSSIQLSPDSDSRLLLDKGIFAFHSRNSLNSEVVQENAENDGRLLWCMVTLMAREWRAGLRIPADVRTGQWHSTLRDELWLRQKYIRFSPESTFVSAVLCSRGFLNALKTRVCVSRHDLLYNDLSQKLLEDPKARERRFSAWGERSRIKGVLASEMGNYEAYARYILAATLDTEACEQELIPSFVGLLFSLEFGVDDVLLQARQLEKDCATTEDELWTLYQRIQRTEKAWRALFSHSNDSAANCEVGMLRLFSDDADADLFFRREIFMLDFEEFEEFNLRDCHESTNGINIQQEALAVEIDPLIIRTKRKLRKTEKKIKRVQDQIEESEKEYREALLATARRVEHITTTRMALEHAHLRMAMTLLKLSDVQAVVSRLDHAKLVLQNESPPSDQGLGDTSRFLGVLPPFVAVMTIEERKAFLKKEMARYSAMFQTRVVLEEAHAGVKNNVDSTQELETEDLPAALHPLQKEAVSKVHILFVLNLFRSCCCWLAENMIVMQKANTEESENGSEGSDTEQAPTTELLNSNERNSVKIAHLLSPTGALISDGLPRRRSSIKNTRRVLETYHRGCSIVDMLDPDGEAMNATYAASAALLFKEERQAAQEVERERLSTKKVETVSILSERNPITGELEVPPNHLVDINSIPTSTPTESVPVLDTTEIPRNRKKEELQRAIMHRRLQHNSDSDSDDSMDSTQSDMLPVIHGTGLHFGNFVTGDVSWLEDEHEPDNVSSNHFAPLQKQPQDTAITEAMWKRGGVKLADGSALSIKEVLAHAHRLSTSREKLRPGSRHQGVILQAPLDVPLPLEDVQESQLGLVLQRKDSGSPLQSENSSPINEKEEGKRHDSIKGNRRLLARASSMSYLSPDTKSISTSPVNTETELPLKPDASPLSAREGYVKDTQSGKGVPEEYIVPVVHINTRSRPSSAITLPTEPATVRQKDDNIVSISQDQVKEVKEEEDIMEVKSNLNEEEELMGAHENEKPEELAVDVPEPMIQSPVVQISTSETQSRPLLTPDGVIRPLQSDPLTNSVNTLIKWEDATALEAFPLQVVTGTQSRPVSAVQRNSINWEKESLVPRVGSLRLAKAETRSGDHDDLLVTRFVRDSSEQLLEPPSENANEVIFTLHGKSLTMAKKQKRMIHRSNTPGTVDKIKQYPKEAQNTMQTRTIDDVNSNYPDSLRLTPSIKVRVVTQPAKREEEVVEPPEIVIDLPVAELSCKKPPAPSPKPFVKLEGIVDVETHTDTSSPLHLDGVGLVNTLSKSSKIDSIKRDQQQISLPFKLPGTARTSGVPDRQSRGRAPVEPLPSSPASFTLQGARMTPKTKTVEELLESTGCEGMAPLSKVEKERVWQEFVSEPLSASVHDAYSVLYPRSYPLPVATERQTQQGDSVLLAGPTVRKVSCQLSLLAEPSPLSHLALRVSSTRKPEHKEIEVNKKFWSAVEGYRAIGSSPLIPLDSATITQRRQDKAKAIYVQFFRGQRATTDAGDYRGLALAWLEMYPKAVADMRRQLLTAPKGLFDELQRTAELQISAALAKQRADEALV